MDNHGVYLKPKSNNHIINFGQSFFHCKEFEVMKVPLGGPGVGIQVFSALLRSKSHLSGSSQFSDCICYNHLHFITVFGIYEWIIL